MSKIIDTLYDKYGADFFKEEVRCGFLVTTERKKLWAVELDLLEKFMEVCNQHNLRYYAICGTLLGAVRHKGFIPWDDDIDVVMPREDYETLCSIRETIFRAPYFLQTPTTDSAYAFSFMKLRNSETTALSPYLVKSSHNMNMGIFLDVFPLDKVVHSKLYEIREQLLPMLNQCSAFMKRHAVLKREKDLKQIADYDSPNHTAIKLYNQIQLLARRYENDIAADEFAINSIAFYKPEKISWPSHCFEDVTYLPFEHLQIAVPSEYEEILKINYGDYMQFPPVESRGVWHDGIFYPDLSYEEEIQKYIAEHKENE